MDTWPGKLITALCKSVLIERACHRRTQTFEESRASDVGFLSDRNENGLVGVTEEPFDDQMHRFGSQALAPR